MLALVRKLHIYAGLVLFSQFLVYGIAGLVATVQPSLERSKTPHIIRTLNFETRAGEADKDMAARAYKTLDPPMSRPVPDVFLRRNPDGNLLLDFYNINGIYRITVLEKERRLRVEQIRNSTSLFLEDIHAATAGDFSPPGLMKIWAVWNEVGMWGLLFFSVSGAYLWLASRPRLRWPWFLPGGQRSQLCRILGGSSMNRGILRNVHLACGLLALPFLLMYGVSAVQMANSKWIKLRPVVTERQVALAARISDGQKLYRVLNIQGDLRSLKAIGKDWQLQIALPGTIHDVSYNGSSGVASVKTSRAGFLGMLNRLHHAGGMWPDYWPLKLWGAAVGIVSLAVIGLAVTGLWMWWQRRDDRVTGLVLITGNLGFALVVLGLIRSAGP